MRARVNGMLRAQLKPGRYGHRHEHASPAQSYQGNRLQAYPANCPSFTTLNSASNVTATKRQCPSKHFVLKNLCRAKRDAFQRSQKTDHSLGLDRIKLEPCGRSVFAPVAVAAGFQLRVQPSIYAGPHGDLHVKPHAFDTSKPLVERRFLCFCFFFAVGKRNEVPPRTGANRRGTEQQKQEARRSQTQPRYG